MADPDHQRTTAETSAEPPAAAAWNELCQTLQSAGQRILAHAPQDALDQAEGYRYLARLTRHALRQFIETPQPLRPVFDFEAPKIGGDNPDFVYCTARISGAHDYRIEGHRRDCHNLGIGSYSGGLGTGAGLQCSGYIDLDQLECAADGSFTLVASRQRQAGNWLPLTDASNALIVRQTLLDRSRERAAELRIAPVTAETSPPAPLDPLLWAQSLRTVALFVDGVSRQFLRWTDTFKQHPNQLLPTPPELLSLAQGDPNTRYYNGYFELADDEALLVELDPPRCRYWNIQVANHWLESLDFLDYRTHFNHATAKPDADGRVRILIARRDPGAANWIDTAGHARGCLALRWVHAERDSQPITRVVSLRADEVAR